MSPLSTQNDTMASSRVLYEDNHLLVLFKPGGMLTQGDQTGDPCLMDWGKAYLKEKYHKPGNVFLGLVHRLDKHVPGVVLFAKTSKGASRLSEQFRERRIDKKYLAVVEGTPPRTGTLTHYLGDDGTTGVRVQATPGPGLKKAEMRYTVLESQGNKSLLEVNLLTGRKHQIRAQLAAIGHPIVADRKYGSRYHPRNHAIALLAHALRFKLPTQEQTKEVVLPEGRDHLRRFFQ